MNDSAKPSNKINVHPADCELTYFENSQTGELNPIDTDDILNYLKHWQLRKYLKKGKFVCYQCINAKKNGKDNMLCKFYNKCAEKNHYLSICMQRNPKKTIIKHKCGKKLGSTNTKSFINKNGKKMEKRAKLATRFNGRSQSKKDTKSFNKKDQTSRSAKKAGNEKQIGESGTFIEAHVNPVKLNDNDLEFTPTQLYQILNDINNGTKIFDYEKYGVSYEAMMFLLNNFRIIIPKRTLLVIRMLTKKKVNLLDGEQNNFIGNNHYEKKITYDSLVRMLIKDSNLPIILDPTKSNIHFLDYDNINKIYNKIFKFVINELNLNKSFWDSVLRINKDMHSKDYFNLFYGALISEIKNESKKYIKSILKPKTKFESVNFDFNNTSFNRFETELNGELAILNKYPHLVFPTKNGSRIINYAGYDFHSDKNGIIVMVEVKSFEELISNDCYPRSAPALTKSEFLKWFDSSNNNNFYYLATVENSSSDRRQIINIYDLTDVTDKTKFIIRAKYLS